MAAVIGDFVSDLSRFHDMIVNPASLQNQNQHPQHQPQRHNSSSSPCQQRSRSRSAQTHDDASSPPRPASRPRPTAAAATPRPLRRDAADKQAVDADADADARDEAAATTTHRRAHEPSAGGASRIPSPPPSSSPTVATGPSPADDAKSASMASNLSAAQRLSAMSAPTTRQQPSPPADDLQIHNPPDVTSTRQNPEQRQQQTVVHVRDLAHIQTLASTHILGGSGSGSAAGAQIKYEISGMPIGDIIEMVAALLTKITTTNDLQHDAMQRNVAHQQQANQNSDAPGGSQMSPLSHSVLAFHGKNVPAITILSYLSRIHKYCPTTYEVFLSLLVYFDRMTERVNDMVMKSEEVRRRSSTSRPLSSHQIAPPHDTTMRDHGHAAQDSDESDSDLADDDDEDDDDEMVDSPSAPTRQDSARIVTVPSEQPPVVGPATYFVVDSFNIHRLIIAGVTCASKFFSDVFYTNSRYAKVGGLPLAELNHLEIQFLVLNDFRLAVPVEDLEAYATMLVEFYAREVIAQDVGTGPGA